MKTLKLGYRDLGIPDKIAKVRGVAARLDGNPFFPDPNPSLKDLTAAVNALETAHEQAQDGSRPKKLFMKQCEAELNRLFKALGASVQSASMGDEHIIASAGFDVRASRGQLIRPENPAHVRGKSTIHAGEVVIRWNAAQAARIYLVEMSDDGTEWTSCGVVTKVKMTITGLESGSKPAFRVAALGASGQSGWSDPGYVRVD